MDNFIPSEYPGGVEQLKRSAVIAAQNVARLRSQLENEPDEFTRSRLLKLLLLEAEKSRLTCQRLDRIDGHMAELRELTYRQVELVEKGNFKGQIVERAVKLLATLNDLMANYQTLRRRISLSQKFEIVMPDLESDFRKLTTDARQMAEENARLRKINSQMISALEYVLPLLQQGLPATVDFDWTKEAVAKVQDALAEAERD